MVISLGCSTISVSYDYDTKTDFTSLKTFDFMHIPVQSNINRLNVKRIRDAVRNQLESKGYTQTPDNPDFQIAMHLSKQEKTQLREVTDWGYTNTFGRRINWGDNTSTRRIYVNEYEEGTLILDFVDAQSKELSWRGVAKAEIRNYKNPEKREKRINAAVQKILNKFPPTKKY
jgi:hypothetical protein